MVTLQDWYLEIPPVTRFYLTCSVLVTVACSLEIISPFTLYFNVHLIFLKWQVSLALGVRGRMTGVSILTLVEASQVWRLFTNFFFFGAVSLDFLFHMFFLVRYCRQLEEGSFRGRTADFLVMMLFGGSYVAPSPLQCQSAMYTSALQPTAPPPCSSHRLRTHFNLGSCMCCVAPFINIPPFLGSSLAFMMVRDPHDGARSLIHTHSLTVVLPISQVYVWGRRNEYVRMSFLGLFQFRAPFLPWVRLAKSLQSCPLPQPTRSRKHRQAYRVLAIRPSKAK